MLRSCLAAIAALSVAQVTAPLARPTLPEILVKVASYVTTYQKDLRGIVAEETYSQNVTSRARGGRITHEGRQLKSDLLLVKLSTAERWLQFRDVFEVDRKPVRDRDQRLYRLFVTPGADAQAQAEEIQKESSRYNLGPILRNINIPILALFIFDSFNQYGVSFELAEAGNVKRLADLAPAESISLVNFKETTKDTLIRGAKGLDLPSHGRAWIDHTTGRILETEMISQDTSLRAQITVTYRNEPGLPVLVPEQMREIYTIPRNDTRIDGRATYGRFRQFTVTTTEKPKRE